MLSWSELVEGLEDVEDGSRNAWKRPSRTR